MLSLTYIILYIFTNDDTVNQFTFKINLGNYLKYKVYTGNNSSDG